MFTKKHYIEIGKILKRNKDIPQIKRLTNDFIALFEWDNKNFDKEKFINFLNKLD